jgi:hypothetical protein
MNLPHKTANGYPIPIRFAAEDEIMLHRLKELTGIPISSLIRRSVCYAVPRFIDGRVDLFSLNDNSHDAPVAKD